MATRKNVLMLAYACLPGRGSEPGIGWHLATAMAGYHNVWVLTWARNRPIIEAELARSPVPGLHIVYHDIRWPNGWNYDQHKDLMEFHYYFWQRSAQAVVQRLHRDIGFDLTNHVTFGRYWMPSALAALPVPLVWGPVGGGESAPRAFHQETEGRDRVMESLRDVARWLGERDPFVRRTAARSTVALATTQQSAERMARLQPGALHVLPAAGLGTDEIDALGALPSAHETAPRFISIGRLLHWKGFHYGLAAFAQAQIPDAEYWIVGDGPERSRLEALTRTLGIAERVRFWGVLEREETLDRLGACRALVHPSLHDSGGFVCLEAMAARRPVLCLDLGGPGTMTTPETGIALPAQTPQQVVADLADAIQRLSRDTAACTAMGEAGYQRVRQDFSWSAKARRLNEYYLDALGQPIPEPTLS